MNMKEARPQAQPGLVRKALLLRPLLFAVSLSFTLVVSHAEQHSEPIEGKPLVHPGIGAADFQRELDIHVQKTNAPAPEPEPDSTNPLTLLLCVALIPGVIFLWRRFGAFYQEHFAPLESAPAASQQLPADDKLFSDFVAAFEAASGNAASENSNGLVRADKSHTGSTGAGSTSSWVTGAPGPPKPTVVEKFFEIGPERLELIRTRFSEVSRAPTPAAQQKNLEPLPEIVRSFVLACNAPELRPLLQLGRGLEGLLKQMSENPSNITPSTLRTAAAAIVLLETICKPGMNFELATRPPARFLVVDDDPISRHAVSTSLKKVFSAPDVAENGEAALKLATANLYDVVFLDIEMPGMDGYEVCSRIHETDVNKTTPVVFVTSHTDFDSRTKSIEVGGHDIIGKPFLAFEITVKALTLLMRNRLCKPRPPALEPHKASREAPDKDSSPAPVNAPPPAAKPDPKALGVSLSINEKQTAQNPKSSSAAPQPARSSAPSGDRRLQSPGDTSSEPTTPSAKEYAEVFAVHGPEHLREMQKQVSALGVIEGSAERQEILGELYIGLNLLRSEAARAGLKIICEVTSGLGKLVAKLLDKPALFMPSALQAMEAAIQLLEELSRGGVEQDLTAPPIRVLVVDDDPLARRSVSHALQLTFDKPDNADCGQAAVALAGGKAFDVIFLDILMPDMDGFETCSKIRQTKLNGATPVIFVTSRDDNESRGKALHCGGNGFITKPVLPAEIFLTALTFTLRGRMEKGNARSPVEKLEAAVC